MSTLLSKTVARLRRTLDRVPPADTDQQLLARFTATGDEQAFGEIVRRHGALVLGVCRRVLGNDQDAEDAFQATFLVLARKAGSLAWQDNVKNWLYGVAQRVAMKAACKAAQRRHKERAAAVPMLSSPGPEASWEELRGVLDEELARLPARYRAPLLLCYLEGKTRDEAAEELGWSAGSVKGRLERGRELLRQRLVRRGLPLSAVLCASFLGNGAAGAAPSALLIETTLHSSLGFMGWSTGGAAVAPNILHLAQGVLHAMVIAKIKTLLFSLLCLGLLGLGGWLAHDPLGARETDATLVQEDQPRERPKNQGRDKEKPRDGDVKRESPREGGDRGKERERETGEVRAMLRSLDADKGTITVVMAGEGERAEKTLSITKNASVQLITGQPVRLADLTPRTLLLLKLGPKEDVQAIRVQLPTVTAALAGVDAVKNSITLRLEREARPMTVAKDARLQLNGRPAALKEFAVGTRVNVTLNLERSVVLAMQGITRDAPREGERPRDGEKPRGKEIPRDGEKPRDKEIPRDGEKPRGKEIPRDGEKPRDKERPRDGDRPRDGAEGRGRVDGIGVVVGISQDKNTVDILTGAENDLAIKTYPLAKDAELVLRLGRTPHKFTLAQLARAVRVQVQLSQDQKSIVRLEAVAPMFRAVLGEIDSAGKVLNFRGEGGNKQLPLAREVIIQLPGLERAQPADLAAGQQVMVVLSLDRSQVVGVIAIRGERDRE